MAHRLQHGAAPRQPRPSAAPHLPAEVHVSPRVYFQTVRLTGELTHRAVFISNSEEQYNYFCDLIEFYKDFGGSCQFTTREGSQEKEGGVVPIQSPHVHPELNRPSSSGD